MRQRRNLFKDALEEKAFESETPKSSPPIATPSDDEDELDTNDATIRMNRSIESASFTRGSTAQARIDRRAAGPSNLGMLAQEAPEGVQKLEPLEKRAEPSKAE